MPMHVSVQRSIQISRTRQATGHGVATSTTKRHAIVAKMLVYMLCTSALEVVSCIDQRARRTEAVAHPHWEPVSRLLWSEIAAMS